MMHELIHAVATRLPLQRALATGLLMLMLVACGGGETPPPAGQPESAQEASGQISEPIPEAGLQEQPGLPTRDLRRVVATVNGEPVTQGQLDRETMKLAMRLTGSALPPHQLSQVPPAIEERAFEQLVLARQLRAYAKQNELHEDPMEIDAVVKRFEESIGDPATVEALLKREGLTRDDLRKEAIDAALMARAIEHFQGQLPSPTDEDLQAHFQANRDAFAQTREQVVVHQILISATPGMDDAERQLRRSRAEALRTQLMAGTDFAELARQHSEDPFAERGGLLGPVTRGRLGEALEEPVFALEPGEISEILGTTLGFHIMLVSQRTEPVYNEFEEVRERVAEDFPRGRMETWYRELTDAAVVEAP